MKHMKTVVFATAFLLLAGAGCANNVPGSVITDNERRAIEDVVYAFANAWETGDIEQLKGTLHEQASFVTTDGAYESVDVIVEAFNTFQSEYENTKVSVHNILIDTNMAAVEWRVTTTNKKSGKLQSVSAASIVSLKNGKILRWKEYKDSAVAGLQASGTLPADTEGELLPRPLAK